MRVMVVGSGGREHALVWKIAQSKRVKKVYAVPGNAGMASQAALVDIDPRDKDRLRDFAKSEKIDLTVVGPEAPLVAGIVDDFRKEGLRIFGPGKDAAALEGSKVFAKETMREFGVPTAEFSVFEDSIEALSFVKKKGMPIVIKADGLATGKGVYVCRSVEDAGTAIDDIMVKRIFGDAGNKVVIEECLDGEEASIIVVSDGEGIIPLASSQDHKRIYDDDKGPNTGGMGAYSPAPIAEGARFDEAIRVIIEPMIKGLRKKGAPYRGALYAGIMITAKGMYTLEFNVRFGDPETQAILPRMKSDIMDLFEASIDGTAESIKALWDRRPCVSVVAASGGYPGKYDKGKRITGLDDAAGMKDVVVFHAGTAGSDGNIVTSGGRVLGITALGDNIEQAVKRAYEAAQKIHFDGMYYRKDIGRRALCSRSRL